MHVLFIEVDTEFPWGVASIGPAFLAAGLRNAGHTASLFRATMDHDEVDVLDRVREEAPGLIGVSMTTRQWLRGKALIAHVKASVDVPVIAGGLHPTFAPEAVLESPGFDFVCLGEGDQAILDLVAQLEAGLPGDAPNLWRRGGARPALREPFSPVDALPWMARDFLDERHGFIHMTTQRGCPFPCTYCAARMYDEMYEARGGEQYGRRRSVDNVLAELEAIAARQHVPYVIFLDDTFTIHHPWVREFGLAYRSRIGAPFCLHARVETVSERLLGELAEAGCAQITYGVESGSPRVRRDVMKRFASNERFRDVFRWTAEAGISIIANYMLGMPEETPEDLQMTLDLAASLEVTDFSYFVFYPYPGTQLFHTCRERGYLPDDWLTRPANHRESILKLPTLSQADIADYYARFTDLRADLHARRSGSAATAYIQASADCG